jgi:hypothetical protein
MALKPADDAALKLVRLSSHGSAVAGIGRFPERHIGIAALTGGKDSFRVVRRNVVVGEPMNQEHGDAARGDCLRGILLSEIDAVSPASVENAGFD